VELSCAALKGFQGFSLVLVYFQEHFFGILVKKFSCSLILMDGKSQPSGVLDANNYGDEVGRDD